VQKLLIRTLQQRTLWRFLGCGQGFFFSFKIERIGSGRLQSGTGGQKRIPQNLLDSGAKIRARLERRKPLQCPGVSLLHKILSFCRSCVSQQAKL
jgi:hypothetical protein